VCLKNHSLTHLISGLRQQRRDMPMFQFGLVPCTVHAEAEARDERRAALFALPSVTGTRHPIDI
jgi:hypothetical protein